MSEVDKLKGEVDRYVADYNRMFGHCKLKIIGALFGRRIRKLTDMSTREFMESTGLFMCVPNAQGGVLLWSRSVELPNV